MRRGVESRVFLFIDMEGSTGLAERLGPLAFHRLVNRFVDDLTQPIVAARGEIHRYVGDELIATWKLEEGIADGRCVAACFAAIDQLARRAPDYRREFGAAVTVSAGLHCGPVVTGEMGSVKREIVFLGDTVNTAARIQELCRETGDRVLASADLIDRLELPRGNRQTLAWRSEAARQGRRPRALCADEGAAARRPLPRPRRRDRAGGNAGRAVVTGILNEFSDRLMDGSGVRDLSQSTARRYMLRRE